MQEHPGGEIPMRQPQFIRSNTFHRALMVAGVFAVFVIALFGFIYWQIDDYLTARSDRASPSARRLPASSPAPPVSARRPTRRPWDMR